MRYFLNSFGKKAYGEEIQYMYMGGWSEQFFSCELIDVNPLRGVDREAYDRPTTETYRREKTIEYGGWQENDVIFEWTGNCWKTVWSKFQKRKQFNINPTYIFHKQKQAGLVLWKCKRLEIEKVLS